MPFYRQLILSCLIGTSLALAACNSSSSSTSKTVEVASASPDFSQQQRLIADQFISIFENGSTKIEYDYAEDIDDGRGITAGRAGFTSATGDMLQVIQYYQQLKPSNSLNKYQTELQRLEQLRYNSTGSTAEQIEADRVASASTQNLAGLIEAWKQNATLDHFKQAQDHVVNKLYYQPALAQAKALGMKLPLSLLSLYDTNIMHGESGMKQLIADTTRLRNQRTPKSGDDEMLWLKQFNQRRRAVLMAAGQPWSDAVERITELEDLIKANNTQLTPFTMTIQAYGDEKHVLPRAQ